MRRDIGFGICFFTLAIFTALPAVAFADEAHSYEQLCPNGKYVFVMLSKSPDAVGTVDTLKQRYPHSGLYRADNSRKPLWRVNWYSSQVHISSDGAHLVRIGRTNVAAINGQPNVAQLAIAFYRDGKLIKKYLIENLIPDPRSLFRSKEGPGFEWQKRIAFDDESGRLEAALVTGQVKIFDIKTGKMIGTKTNAQRRR